MKLNVEKCNYMIFTGNRTDFATRLTIEYQKLKKISVAKFLDCG